MPSRNIVLGYSGELVEVWRFAALAVRDKADKSQINKHVMRFLREAPRQLVEGGKVNSEDWRAVIVRLQRLANNATKMVPVISTAPKLKEIQAAPSSTQANVRPTLTIPPRPLQKRGREPAPSIDSGSFKDMCHVKLECHDCSEEFLFSASQ